VDIPYSKLEPDLLRKLVEEFVSREGTDYGDVTYDLDAKVEAVLRQLKRGEVTVTFDPETETASIHVSDERRR